MVKKIAIWLAIAFVVYFAVTAPSAAGGVARGAAHALGAAGHSILAFFDSLRA